MDFTQDGYDLAAAWRQAARSFAETTGERLDGGSIPSPNQVVGLISSRDQNEKKGHTKLAAAKSVLKKTVRCVLRFGQAASNIASMIIGPSDLSMNAIQIFIQSAMDFRNIYKSLEELFSRICDAIERFSIYLENQDVIDLAMKRIAHEILLTFVKICELSYKFAHSNHALQYLKTLAYQDDAGVKDELNKLARLVERESQMRGALTYVSAKNTEKTIDTRFSQTLDGIDDARQLAAQSLQSIERIEASNDLQRQLKEIKKALGEPEETYQEECQACVSGAVPGTGEWLHGELSYTNWSDPDHSDDAILVFSGNEGYGKTYLMSAVVQFLEKQYPQGKQDATRISIAYYYFRRLEQEAKGNPQAPRRDLQSIDKALRTLAWQIAQNDLVYRKDLAARLRDSRDLSNIMGLWDKLFMSHSSSDATFFILLDGVDELDENQFILLLDILKVFQSRPKGLLRVKLLLTGRIDTLKRVKDGLGIVLATVDVASKNGNEIAKYIQKRVDNIQILKGLGTQVQALRDEVCIGLTENARGDFINIDLLLEEISKMQRPNEIRNVLEKAKDTDRSDNFANKIKRINQTLSAEDIEDLNMLLTWVIRGYQTYGLRELEAVLFSRKQESNLRPLQERIRDEFSIFFDVRAEDDDDPDAKVTLKADTIKEYFEKASSPEVDRTLSTNMKISETEVKVVRQFLKSLCDQELFAKFQFEEFFESKLGRATAVSVDLETAHARILHNCLQIVLGEFTEDVDAIKSYAMYWFPDHLKEVDLSLTDLNLKSEIGKRLVAMFRDESAIERWVEASSQFLTNEDFVEGLMKWFRDSAATKKLSEEDKVWVHCIISNTDLGHDFLEYIARYQGKAWLQESDKDVSNYPFQWLRGFLNKIEHRRSSDSVKYAANDFWIDEAIEPEEIYSAASWVWEAIGASLSEYGLVCRLGETFRLYGMHQEAVGQFQAALLLNKDHWKAQRGLAATYGHWEKWTLAVETMEPVIRTLEDEESKIDGRESVLQDVLRSVAVWQRKARNFDAAREIYRRMLENNPRDYAVTFNAIKLMDEQDNIAEAVEFLKSMSRQLDETTKKDRLTQMFFELVQEENYHATIIKVAKKNGSFELIKKSYQTAIEAADSSSKIGKAESMDSARGIFAQLLYYYALALYRHDLDLAEKNRAIELWEQVLTLRRTKFDMNLWLAKRGATAKLTMIYLTKAKEAGMSSDLANRHLQKLEGLRLNDSIYSDNDAGLEDRQVRYLRGRYYSVMGEREKAMEYLKPSIELGLALLSDDDPSNDHTGYETLADCFTFFSDEKNALAAWSLIRPTTNLPVKQPAKDSAPSTIESKESRPPGIHTVNAAKGSFTEDSNVQGTEEIVSTEDGNEFQNQAPTPFSPPTLTRSATSYKAKKPLGPLDNGCDGNCGTSWTYPDDIYACKDCIDVWFDPGCLELLKKGELTWDVCNKNHEFLHIPKYDFERAEEIGMDNVAVGDKVMSVKDWLDSIRVEWGVPVKEAVGK